MHQRWRLMPPQPTLRRPRVLYPPATTVVLAPIPPPACPAAAAAAPGRAMCAIAGEVAHARVARAAV